MIQNTSNFEVKQNNLTLQGSGSIDISGQVPEFFTKNQEFGDSSKIFQTDLPTSPKIQVENEFSSHLEFINIKDDWRIEDKELLYEYHNLFGNKWSKMTTGIKRSDNCIKNHFYSTERRSLRKLNKYIVDKKMKGIKPFPNTLLTKILSTAEQKFNSNSRTSETIQKSVQIKNLLFRFDINSQKSTQVDNQLEIIINLILQIRGAFSKRNKNKKPQKKIPIPSSLYQNQLKIQLLLSGHKYDNPNLHTTSSQIFQLFQTDNEEILEQPPNIQTQNNNNSYQSKDYGLIDFNQIQQNVFTEDINYFDLMQFQNKKNKESTLFETYAETDFFLYY